MDSRIESDDLTARLVEKADRDSRGDALATGASLRSSAEDTADRRLTISIDASVACAILLSGRDWEEEAAKGGWWQRGNSRQSSCF